MRNLSRRQLLTLGATGIMAGRTFDKAAAAEVTVGGVHVHATLDQVEGPVGTLKLLIDATAWGSDDNLTGIGYDALPDMNNPGSVNAVQIGPCIWTQAGSIEGDMVRMAGRVMYAHVPVDHSAEVIVEANLATGRIRLTFDQLPPGVHLGFAGSGTVARI